MHDGATTTSGASREATVRTWLIALIAVILTGIALRALAIVVVPAVSAIFLALVVAPVRDAIAARLPESLRWIGTLCAMGVIVVVLCLFLAGLWYAVQRVARTVPQIVESVAERLPEPSGSGGTMQRLMEMLSEQAGMLGERIASFATGTATGILNSMLTTIAGLVLVFFLTLLMLIEGPRWRAKLGSLTSDSTERHWVSAVAMLGHKLRVYLLARTALGLLTAALYTAWLWLFGVDLLVVWALLALLLNFVPNIGSIISGMLPVLYALVTRDLATAAVIAAGILVLEQVLGNYVDPKVQGAQVALSPIVVLLVILFWGWVWGVFGTLLAVPVTIAFVVAGAHIDALRPMALMLTDRTDMDGLDDVMKAEDADKTSA